MGARLGTPGVVGFFKFIFFLGPKLSRDRSEYHFEVRDGVGKVQQGTGVGQVRVRPHPREGGTENLEFFLDFDSIFL